MSRFLCRAILHAGPPRCAVAALLRLRLQTSLPARPFSSQSPDAAAAGPSGNVDPHPSPTVSYLIRSCGLSPEAALSASKKVHLRDKDEPDSVLGIFRDSGFSPSQIASIVSKLPGILRMRAAENLEPKLECLRQAGISGHRLAEFLCKRPYFLLHSAKNKMAPSLELLQRVLPAGVTVGEALGLSTGLIPVDQLPNVQFLRQHGVPDAGILKLLTGRLLMRMRSPARLGEIVAAVQAMGLDPAKPTFPRAVRVMAYLSKETWDRKFAIYRSLGWSDGETSSAFVKQPNIMTMSDEGIRRKMDFFAGKLQMNPAKLCKNPVLFMLNLDKRIAPRCAVLKVLVDRGILQVRQMPVAWLIMPEERYVDRFVVKYREEAPEVMDAHLGKVEFSGFGTPARMGTSLRKRKIPDSFSPLLDSSPLLPNA